MSLHTLAPYCSQHPAGERCYVCFSREGRQSSQPAVSPRVFLVGGGEEFDLLLGPPANVI